MICNYVTFVMFVMAFNFELSFCICWLSFYCMVSPFFCPTGLICRRCIRVLLKLLELFVFFTFLDCTLLDCYLKTSFSRAKKPKRNIIYIFYTQVQERIYLKIYLKLF